MNILKITDNVFSNYEYLESLFPSRATMLSANHLEESKEQLVCSVFSNPKMYKEWKDIIDLYINECYLVDTLKYFNKNIGNFNMSSRFDTAQTRIKYDFKFVRDSFEMSLNGMKSHVDSPNKILQTMLYFKHPKDLSTNRNVVFGNNKVEYVPNRKLDLIHVDNNWHHVTGSKNINEMSNYERKMITIIFEEVDYEN